jgi:hypothetical protein
MADIWGYGEPADWGSGGLPTLDGVTAGTDWSTWFQKTAQSLLGTYAELKIADLRAGRNATVQGSNRVPEGQRQHEGQRQGDVVAGGVDPIWILVGGAVVLFLILRK